MKLLLHTCCATCAAGVIEQLKDKFSLTCYFYNPNIHPREEYGRRLFDVQQYCEKVGVTLIQGEYDEDRWLEKVKGLENEPEGGQRCWKCYTMRLEAAVMVVIGSRDPIHLSRDLVGSRDPIHLSRGRRGPLTSPRFDFFGATLTISPRKKAESINKIGQSLGQKYGAEFYKADFKKNNGFKCACEVARREGFYRQDYCGCAYSQKHAITARNKVNNKQYQPKADQPLVGIVNNK